MKTRVIAVIVTYNRINYLKSVISAIREQIYPLSEIVIINNNSTDGTSEWLARQDGITVIEQENVGGAGGFFTGMNYAFSKGYDWIWIMDDDVCPDKNCLGNLLENFDEDTIRCPLRYSENEKPYKNDTLKYNFTNPFKSLWGKIVGEEEFHLDHYKCEGPTFEGPLFHKNVIENIGLPEKDFFIYADDTEFFIRAKRAGFKIIVNNNAKMKRLIDPDTDQKRFTWKHYYIIRNQVIIDRIYGNLPVKLLRPLAYFVKWLLKAKNFEDIKTILKAYKDAYKFRRIEDTLPTKENGKR